MRGPRPAFVRCARAGVIAASLGLPFAAPPHADCTTAWGVHLNEIRYLSPKAPEGGSARLDPQIELYNKSPVAIPLPGWKITDAQGNTRAFFGGAITLPSGAYLEIMLGSGPTDLDFSDGVGTFYTGGDSLDQFQSAGDAVALYDMRGAIQDFVSWSSTGTSPSGLAVDDAVAAGIWTSGAAVTAPTVASLFTIRLLPDGFDHDTPSDWVQCGWGESNYGNRTAGPNQLQLSPADGIGLSPGPVPFVWDSVAAATSYHVRIVMDPATTELDSAFATTSTTASLPPGIHHWSVRARDACGDVGPEVSWTLVIFPTSVPGATVVPSAVGVPEARSSGNGVLLDSRVLGVPLFYQHKDTRLLCISAPNGQGNAPTWPGCSEAAGNLGPWDDAHPIDHAEHRDFNGWAQCPHCNSYCARAANQMINAYFGGSLSQDRLSFAQEDLGDRDVPSPEGDLCGHGYSSTPEMIPLVLGWALINSTISGPFDNDYDGIRAEIIAGYPVRFSFTNGKSDVHAGVIDGFMDDALGLPIHLVHVLDPWPTRASGWFLYPLVQIGHWYRIRPAGNGPVTGRLQEASVTTDTDGDGVMDFDEGNTDFGGHGPRKFQSRGDRVDTDGDQVHDKQEIRSYTFHALDHPTHPVPHPSDLNAIGPDPDHDGLRAELDPDSDNDQDFDGAEDKNRNGKSPEVGESCVYYPAPSTVTIVVTGGPYVPLSPVTLAGQNFSENSNYTYYVYNGCPLILPVGSAYAGYLSVGTVASDANGAFQIHLSGLSEGCYTVALDVLGDGLYGDVIAVPGGGVVSEVLDKTASFSVVASTNATTALPRFLDLALGARPARGPIEFTMSLPSAGRTRLAVYDVGGKLVRVLFDGWSSPGAVSARWDGGNTSGAPTGSGVYYARLTAAGNSVTREVIRLR